MKKFFKALFISLIACALFTLIRFFLARKAIPILEEYYLFLKYFFIIALAFYLARPALKGAGYSKKEALILSLVICLSLPTFFSTFYTLLILSRDTYTSINAFDLLISTIKIFSLPTWWTENIWMFPLVFFILIRKPLIIQDNFFD